MSAIASASDFVREQPWKRINWTLWWARIKKWSWDIVIKMVLGIIYFAWISQGIRHLLPDAGTKLYKLPIPGFSELEHYETGYRLDTAHFGAIVLLLLSWISWNFVLRMYISDELKERFESWKWKIPHVRPILLITAVLVIVGDGGLFYAAFNHVAFGDSKFSATALVATVVYMTILVLVNFISLYLAQCVNEAKKEIQP